MPDRNYDAVIIGGGAAGLFCAIQAGKRGRRVAVLEHNAEVGRKIVISGGGRCNFTNIHTEPENFVSQNPHFPRSALAGYPPRDFIELVERHRIPYYEKTLGQLFCRDTSRVIVEMLLAECRVAKAKVFTSCRVEQVQHDGGFVVSTNLGEFHARKVVIACGGLSFPKVGASGFGYDVARQFGLSIVETRASLVALVADKQDFVKLAGISVDSVVSTGGRSFRENILFTHRGLSGPAILQASNYWKRNEAIEIDLAPETDVAEFLFARRQSNANITTMLSEVLPTRLAEHLAPATKLTELSDAEIERISANVNAWKVKFTRTEGWDRAEVTLGGVSTDELSSKTMEAKKIPGLYFIGEVIDVTGWLGGYNFQWAWSSAHAAAKDL